jgi:hypothetical protein
MEATEVFFSVTKLFQSKDIGLRRMVYLVIKEISPSSDEVFTYGQWHRLHALLFASTGSGLRFN